MISTELSRKHPCYDSTAAHKVARVHLPVAPKCNIQCKYCSRKYDCMNESRPGVSSAVLSPAQAALYLEKVAEKIPVGVTGIAGPGDAFAEPERTLETIRRCRKKFPDMIFCLSTNGVNLPDYIEEIVNGGVTHLTVTVNTLDPLVGQDIYSWARYKKHNYRGLDAAKLIIDRQLESIMMLKDYNISVKINTILIPGVNEDQIAPIAKTASDYGCELMNIIPLIPVEGTVFENAAEPSCSKVEFYRGEAQEYIPQSRHCKRCRADAVGLLGEETDEQIKRLLNESAETETGFTSVRSKVAFVSREGLLVNRHLGESSLFYIIEKTEEGLEFAGVREAPEAGTGDQRWEKVSDILSDCAYLLTSGAGEKPVKILTEAGLNVLTIEGLANDAAERLFSGRTVNHMKVRKSCRAGGCGSGTGCG